MTTIYKFKAYYTDAGVGTAQDPAPTCTVINMADDSKLADAQATTASTNMPGLYSYEYSGADGLDCVAWFKTTDTGCDVKELASYVSEKITTNLNADVAGVEAKVDTVDTNVDAILADTGTDGVVVASGQTVATVTNLTNLPTMPTDWLTAAGLKADAVTKIQNGLALEATLTAIKGAGWTGETLAALDALIDGIKAKSDLIPASPAEAGEYTAAIGAIPTAPLLAANYTAPDNAGIAAIKAKTDNLPADPADDSDIDAQLAAIKSVIDNIHDTDLPAVKAETALIIEDTGTTLSNLITAIKSKTDLMDASAITYTPNVVGTDITLLRGDTFSATLTDVGALTGYVSIDFTVKRNTSNTDDEAVIRIRKNASGTGDGLLRLNRAAPTTETGEIVIDDEATGDITITLDETATDSLEIGAYLYDVQLITATAVKTLTSGRLNVTSDVTRAIA